MKKSYVFAAILVLLAATAGRMIERNSPTKADVYHFEPREAVQAVPEVEAYPVDDWYAVEPTIVFPYAAYPAPEYGGYPAPYEAYPAPYWNDPLPTPAPEPTMAYPYPAPEYGGYPYP